jgi:hypothetical protein
LGPAPDEQVRVCGVLQGDYLPLTTDTVVATVITRELCDAYPLLQLPPVPISCSHEHSAWPGTVSISAATLYAIIGDIYSSIARSGLTSLVLVNGHGGNYVHDRPVEAWHGLARHLSDPLAHLDDQRAMPPVSGSRPRRPSRRRPPAGRPEPDSRCP